MKTRNLSTLSLFAAVSAAAYLTGPSTSASPHVQRSPQLLRPRVANLGVSSFLGPDVEGRLAAFLTLEHQEGSSDLNGDGDAEDSVLHVRDRATGQAVNLGLASYVFDVRGPLVAFLVSEFAQGQIDLNGDGDTNDQVTHLYDARTGLTTNLGIAQGLETLAPRIHGELVAFVSNEFAQGGTDLNGDGDAEDEYVLHVHDVRTGITTNLGLTTFYPSVSGVAGIVAFAVNEYGQGQTDLNGDGDVFDSVVHFYDAATGASTNLGLAASGTVSVDGAALIFGVSEQAQSQTDLNADGDQGDVVAFVHDTQAAVTTNLGLAMARVDLSGDLALITVDEENQGGTDLNGDGDVFDRVEHVYNLSTGTTINFGLSSNGFVRDGRYVASRVWESGQGFTDLNGDGDTSDVVLFVHDALTGTTQNLGLAAEFDVQIAGSLVAFRVDETSQGGLDLNGDGDLSDAVLHVHDAALGSTRNLGLAQTYNGIQVHDGRVAFEVREADQGGVSLNGDADAADDVLHVYDSRGGVTFNLGLAVRNMDLFRRTLLFSVPEAQQAGLDLNGDADALDAVVHMARL